MPKSVLLVEDEDSIALALGFLMEREGYELRRVANGTDALAAIRERGREYDLVLFWAFRYAGSFFGLPLVEDRAVLVKRRGADDVGRLVPRGIEHGQCCRVA